MAPKTQKKGNDLKKRKQISVPKSEGIGSSTKKPKFSSDSVKPISNSGSIQNKFTNEPFELTKKDHLHQQQEVKASLKKDEVADTKKLRRLHTTELAEARKKKRMKHYSLEQKEKQGHELTVSESFMHTHSCMNHQGERVCVNYRSRNIYKKYSEKYDSPSSEGGSNTTPPPITTQIERWTEIVEGLEEGRVYGLVGLASTQSHRSHGRGGYNEREIELETEAQGLRQKMCEMMAAHVAKMSEMLAAHDAVMSEMRAQLAFFKSNMMMAQQQQPPPTTLMPYSTPMPNIPYQTLPHAQGTSAVFVPTLFHLSRPPHNTRSGTQEGDDNQRDEDN